jgi:hypothetical protein
LVSQTSQIDIDAYADPTRMREKANDPITQVNRFLKIVRDKKCRCPGAASGVCPPSTARTNRSRPIGVKRAFLWMFIRSSGVREASTTSASPVRAGWTTY